MELNHRCAVCGAPAGDVKGDQPFLCKEHQQEKKSGK